MSVNSNVDTQLLANFQIDLKKETFIPCIFLYIKKSSPSPSVSGVFLSPSELVLYQRTQEREGSYSGFFLD